MAAPTASMSSTRAPTRLLEASRSPTPRSSWRSVAMARDCTPSRAAPGSSASSTRRPCRSSSTSDRKSTRLNSSHLVISYAVFCLKKKKYNYMTTSDQRLIADNILITLIKLPSHDPTRQHHFPHLVPCIYHTLHAHHWRSRRRAHD